MQIQSSINSQTLQSNSESLELRSRELQKSLASPQNLSPDQELQSSTLLANRDRVTLSTEATALSRLASGQAELKREDGELVGLESPAEATAAGVATEEQAATAQEKDLQEKVEQQELEQTRELAQRDREVRTHEQTHASIGGQYASAPSYTYERGPDGRLYAVAGEVKIDTSPVPNDPEATIEKAEIIQRAALSVAEPSGADRAVAAEARVMAVEARAELAKQKEMEAQERAEEASSSDEVDEDRPTAGERLQELRDERAAKAEGAAESLNDFNDRLNEINKELAEINKKLVDAGVFQKLFPEGSLLDQQI